MSVDNKLEDTFYQTLFYTLDIKISLQVIPLSVYHPSKDVNKILTLFIFVKSDIA